MRLQVPVLAAAACGALALPGCGEEKKGEANVSKTKAIQEIAATRVGLEHALAQLRSGDAKAAEDTVAETYLQHFELVEGPLDEVDHELNEELEETINEELRDKIKSGAPPAEVSKLVDSVKDDLETAEAKLR
jgi:outer membrane murein-binding lipoprotein Lpp